MGSEPEAGLGSEHELAPRSGSPPGVELILESRLVQQSAWG